MSSKTTTLNNPSESDLTEITSGSPNVFLVVFGTGPNVDDLVAKADHLAGTPSDPRWVIWIKDSANVENLIRAWDIDGQLPSDFSSTLGIAIFQHQIKAVLLTNQEFDAIDVLTLYAAAEQ